MRSSPVWGFIALIAVAIFVAGIASKVHPNRGSLPPDEQAREDDRQQQEAAQKQAAAQKSNMMTFDQAKEGATKAAMEVEGKGTIIMELYPKAAPKTVAHFMDLCKSHFYDGLKFHRVEPGFVIQGGDPESKDASVAEFESKKIGTHGSGQTVPLEAKLPHTQYSVGLARSDALDSGDSQFYINLKDNNELDGKYCVFGMVTQGQDIAAKVQKGDVIKSITLP
jgi:cyclophilin family peptidyl-prolyl cis-trans isomerase